MGTSGGNTGTAISGGVAGQGSVVEALPYTYLSLPRYAKIMGLNPAHFCRAHAPSLATPVFPIETCSTVWPRYGWQNNDQVSHEELAYAIHGAEQDIINLLGYFPAPDWVEQDVRMAEREYDRQYFSDGLDIRGQLKRVQTTYRKVINSGRRALSLIGTATTAGGALSYVDEDGDGMAEIAKIVLATTVTVPGEIKVYFTGMNGDRDWEIRPIRKRTLSGGTVTILLDSWLLIQPELLAAYPTSDSFRAIDISTTVNFVTSVDVYREYNDNTAVSAEFVWQGVEFPTYGATIDPGVTMTTRQDGVALVHDGELGSLMPVPGSYDAVEQIWKTSLWSEDVSPDYVRLYYYCGDYDNAYLRGFTTDPLSNLLAQTIAWVASARLTRPLCGCGNVADLAENLSEDLSLSVTGKSFFTPVEVIRNPLGTRRGEVMAWRRLSKLIRVRRASVAVI